MRVGIFESGTISAAIIAALVLAGCVDREAEARRARQEAEAKARAEAARKEMDALPKAFKSEPFFKLNNPEKKLSPSNPSDSKTERKEERK